MQLVYFAYRILRRSIRAMLHHTDKVRTHFLLNLYHVSRGKSFRSNGVPIIHISNGGSMQIGDNFTMNNGINHNRIGRQQRCNLMVGPAGKLSIGNRVSMSSVALVCLTEITLGNNVMIGGNVCIYDTDFHALDANTRANKTEDALARKNKAVRIDENVFIGAHCTILKGVHIGANSIVGAGSVVSKSIPANQIWAGNPAKFIRRLNLKKVEEAA